MVIAIARRFPRLMTAFCVMAAGLLFLAPQRAQAGTQHNVRGWLWSASVGWIATNCLDLEEASPPIVAQGYCGAGGGADDFGLTFSDTPGYQDRADLSGFAWAGNIGWVCFGKSCAGNTPEGTPAYAQWRASFPSTSPTKFSEVYGWARIMASSGTDGWISLNCGKDSTGTADCSQSNYRTYLNLANGYFRFSPVPGAPEPPPSPGPYSYAFSYSFGWGANPDGTGLGWLDFGPLDNGGAYVGARTFWTRAKYSSLRRPEGVYEPPCPACPGTHRSTFTIGFTNFSAPSDYLIHCEVERADGGKIPLDKIITVRTCPSGQDSGCVPDGNCINFVCRNVSETLTSTMPAGGAGLVEHKSWFINSCRIAGYRLPATSCTGDANCSTCAAGKCTVGGQATDITCGTPADCLPYAVCENPPGQCRTVVFDPAALAAADLNLPAAVGRKPIYTHDNSWSGTDTLADDQARALQCYGEFYDRYLANPHRCDFEGDPSFTLAMKRSVPVEGDCGNGIDDDGNGQVDCNDRYCRGLSYLCSSFFQRHPASAGFGCVQGDPADGITDCNSPAYVRGNFCCSRENRIVNGLECEYNDPNDGYARCNAALSGDICCELDPGSGVSYVKKK